MPGYKEYLDVESGVKILANLLPEDAEELGESVWKGISDSAAKLHESVDSLATAATGSQKKLAEDLQGIAEQLDAVTTKLHDHAADAAGMSEDEAHALLEKIAPEIATIRGAIKQLPEYIKSFDEKKLKSKRFIFG